MNKRTDVFDKLDNVIGNYTDGKAKEADVVRTAVEVNRYLFEHPHPHDHIGSVDEPLDLDRARKIGATFHDDILFWAFRYALGRMTYAVSDVADAIRRKKDICERVARLMIKEIDTAAEKDAIGMDMDRRQWMEVRQFLVDKHPHLAKAS